MKGERQLPGDRATIWAMLNDPEVLKSCVPGCEGMTPTGENAYDVAMNAAIGPVKARFKGRMQLTGIEPPTRYTLTFDGQSSQAGFARGEARIELTELSPGSTRLAYTAAAQIGGKLAQIGARLLDAAAGATVERFFEAFAARLAERNSRVSAAAGASASPAGRWGFWRWLGSFLRHLTSRRK